MMKIAIGADHAGYALKDKIIRKFTSEDIVFNDFGTNSGDSVDYPDFAHPTAQAVENNVCNFGIVVCGSGNGVNIVANKHKGVRSALCWLPEIAELARQHNNANILALPARFITEEVALKIVDKFLSTSFEGGRHQNRVQKI